ncbi:unnamed protein product [Ectocarpus sp. 6 AP-2014]
MEQLDSACPPNLDAVHRRVLCEMLERGNLVEGTDGLFYGRLQTSNAPEAEQFSGRRHAVHLFWSRGERRQCVFLEAFNACVAAGFPCIFESDAPDQSLLGTSAKEAVERGITHLGTIGRESALFLQSISDSFATVWLAGSASENCLNGKTWVVQNHEENMLSDPHKLLTMQSPTTLAQARRTRLGEVCFPHRGGVWDAKGGVQTSSTVINGSRWCGTEVTSWASPSGWLTQLHVDKHQVAGKIYLPVSVCTVRPVRRDHIGPAKRAIIISPGDMDVVVRVFGLRLEEIPADQCRVKLDLEGLAKVLREHKCKFTVIEFPPDCSYMIPAGAAHMFETLGLIESSGWLPCLKGVEMRVIDVKS